jgi:Leucine-rich repeat (LRR) protein
MDDCLEFHWIIKELNLHHLKSDIYERKDTIITDNRLEAIDLSDLQIKQLTKDTFAGQEFLKQINLSKNHLYTLPKESFKGLKNLQKLIMAGNYLETLPNDVFKDLIQLKYLDLSSNKLSEFQAKHINQSQLLREIKLDNNKIKSLGFLNAGLSDLNYLSIRKNQIEEISANDLKDCSSLEIFYLGDNKISSIPTGVFSSTPNIREIQLDGNNIETLPENVFNKIEALEVLWLQNNLLTYEGIVHSLQKLPNLTHLILNENQIEKIVAPLFSEMSNLQYLLLSSNKIQLIDSNVLMSLLNLKELWLNDNPLDELIAGIFFSKDDIKNALTKYSKVSEAYNMIVNLLGDNTDISIQDILKREKTIIKDDQLISLDLSNLNIKELNTDFSSLNSLTSLDISNNLIESDFYIKSGNLTHLNLSNNGLNTLNSDFIEKLSKLTYLNLSKNELPSRFNREFTDEFDLEELKEVFASYFSIHNQLKTAIEKMKIKDVNRVLKSQYTEIKNKSLLKLDLSHLDLNTIPWDVLFEFKSLKELKLDNNNISIANVPDVKSLELQLLDLRENKITNLESLTNIFSNLTILLLDANVELNLTGINKFSKLEKLSLNSLKLPKITNNLLNKLSTLIELELKDCEIEFIEDMSFINLNLLESLDLSENKIKSFEFLSSINKNIRYINLMNNPNLPDELNAEFTSFKDIQKISETLLI